MISSEYTASHKDTIVSSVHCSLAAQRYLIHHYRAVHTHLDSTSYQLQRTNISYTTLTPFTNTGEMANIRAHTATQRKQELDAFHNLMGEIVHDIYRCNFATPPIHNEDRECFALLHECHLACVMLTGYGINDWRRELERLYRAGDLRGVVECIVTRVTQLNGGWLEQGVCPVTASLRAMMDFLREWSQLPLESWQNVMLINYQVQRQKLARLLLARHALEWLVLEWLALLSRWLRFRWLLLQWRLLQWRLRRKCLRRRGLRLKRLQFSRCLLICLLRLNRLYRDRLLPNQLPLVRNHSTHQPKHTFQPHT